MQSLVRNCALINLAVLLVLAAACAGEPETTPANNGAAAPVNKQTSKAPRIEGQLMIRFKDSVDPARGQEILASEGAEILTRYNDTRMFHIGLPEGLTVEQGIARFSGYEELDFVEPNQVYTTQDSKE